MSLRKLKDKFKLVDTLEIIIFFSLGIGVTSYYRSNSSFSIVLILLGIISSIIRVIIAHDFKRQIKNIVFTFSLSFIVIIMIGFIEITSVSLANNSGNKIDEDTWMDFIGSAIGSGVAVAAAFYTTKLQIDATRKQLAKEEEQKAKSNLRAIARFLKHELRFNYNLIGFSSDMHVGTINFNDITLDEYEKVKYRLLDHQSELIDDIHEIYSLLYELKISKRVFGDEQQIGLLNQIMKLKQRLDQSLINIESKI